MKISAIQHECPCHPATAKRSACGAPAEMPRGCLSLPICVFVGLVLLSNCQDSVFAQAQEAPAASAVPLIGQTNAFTQAQQQRPLSIAEGDQAKHDKEDLVDDVFLRPSRELVQRLNNARRLIERQRYSEAVRLLGWILDCNEDYFVRSGEDDAAFESLKSQAHGMIGRMPRGGLNLYELEYGTKARARLEAATAKQDAAGLAEVSRRYFYTEAGGEATLLLGLWYLDHGRPLAAALIMSRLSELPDEISDEGIVHERIARLDPTLSVALAVCWAQAGMPGKANECLESLRVRFPGGRVVIGGEEVAFFAAGDDPLEWLESQTGKLFAKSPAMVKGTVDDGIPLLNTLWRVNASEYPSADRLLLNQMQFCRERDRSIIAAGRPLAVGDVVLTRTVSTLLAVDFQSGKRLWMIPHDNILDNTPAIAGNLHLQQGQQTGMLCNRYWQNGIYGSLSSDERLVFSVEDLPVAGGFRTRHLAMMGMGGGMNNSSHADVYNRLAAHDIKTGKLVWHVGGKPSGGQASSAFANDASDVLPAAGSFFLGAPLCLSGRLYALAESDGEIRLVALEASTGKLLWTQPLAMAEIDILRDSLRRQRAATPSYTDGILVCPTGNGAIVAVEEATHSLLWGFPFPEESKKDRNRIIQLQQRAAMGIPGYSRHGSGGRLLDNLRIVGDKVLAAAPGGQYLYCLGLFDGKQHWKSNLKGDLFMACADSERVVLIGSHHVRALKMSDGKPAWKQNDVRLGDGASTSGRGFLVGGYYYLPVGKAGVAVLDVQSGRVERVAKSHEDNMPGNIPGNMPGNLICHKGKVISQGLDGLKSYYELGALRRRIDSILAERPDDARALAMQGEILIDQNKRKQAVDSLRRSFERIGGARTEWLLRETLLEGLAEEFAEYRQDSAEIEKLCKDSHDRARYLRLTAEGLEGQQEWGSALDYYLRLADSSDTGDAEVRLSDSHRVHLDRWLQARLARFTKSAPEEVNKRLAVESEKRLSAAIDANSVEPARRFLNRFAYHPVAIKGRDLFVGRLLLNGNLLEAEMLLRQEARSKDRVVAARATLRLAEVLRKANRLEDAADCYRRLAFEFADVDCGEGTTGKQIVASLPKDDAVRRWFQPDLSWPVGLVESSESLFKRNVSVGNNLIDLNFHGSRRPFLGNRQLKYDQSARALLAVDAYGKTRWRLPLSRAGQRSNISFTQNMNHVAARGHLLVLAAGSEYIAIDCADPKSPNILWRRCPDQSLPSAGSVGQVEVNAFWAGMQHRVSPYGLSGRQPWQSCLLTDQYMCYRKFRGVVAIDPISGLELWTYGDLPENCVLFGDENLVFAVPLDGTKATVLRGADGAKLKTVTVPPQSERLVTIGRNVLAWRVESNRRIVELVDPWAGRTIWGPYDFEASAKCSLVGNESLGVLEQSGRFTMLSLLDGRKSIEAKLTPEPNLQEIVLLETDGEHFLVTHSTARRPKGHTPRTVSGASSRLIRKGRVYGFDRQCKRLWPDFPAGVEVEEQHLLLNQPGRLPVLTFASLGYNPQNRSSRWFMSVLMIDKRNGRVVLNKRFNQQAGMLDLIGDPVGKTVDVRMQRSNMRLTFTDKALPPVSKKKKEEKPSGAFGGVLKALQKLTEEKMRELPLPVPGEMQPGRMPPMRAVPKPMPAQRR